MANPCGWLASTRNPSILIRFFERTALDECVSIDIAEKYKIMSLGGHNQTKKKKKTT